MQVVTIPWPDGASWRQSVALDGRVYRMAAKWNEIADCWTLDISTRENDPILQGVKIVGGVLLTSRIADDRLPRGWFVVTADKPGRDDMVMNSELLYVSAV